MAVTIGDKTLPLPILQGGMGVGVSLDGLAERLPPAAAWGRSPPPCAALPSRILKQIPLKPISGRWRVRCAAQRKWPTARD